MVTDLPITTYRQRCTTLQEWQGVARILRNLGNPCLLFPSIFTHPPHHLIGAYLITRANVNFPVQMRTPQGYTCPPGFCFQAVGNLYGFPPAGQNFSIEFDICIFECGDKNTPWDLKFFFKWTTDGRPMLIIAHSDDFRWFGPSDKLDEWDLIIATFNAHKYEITDATDKEFVGIRIQRDEDGTYYMDQHRMIDSIIKEANISGTIPDWGPRTCIVETRQHFYP